VEIGKLWDNITQTDLEKDVLKSLQIIAPRLEGVSLVSQDARRERVPIVRLAGVDQPPPLRSLGDGMNRLFGIALALVNAKDGMLLIDEVENGLHYSVQPDVWKLIFETARNLNVQVFATTHSWDCIEAFQKAAQESPEDGMLIRLAERQGNIISDVFSEKELGIATKRQIELR
jgi:predicted ATPase